MKNTERIRKAVLENKLFGEETERRVEMYERMKIPLPVHTAGQWENEGYQVRDDQLPTPALTLQLWKVIEDGEGSKQFRLVPTRLYTVQQCVQQKEVDHGCIRHGDAADYQ